MTNEIKLLPCPFCGGKAERKTLDDLDEIYQDSPYWNGDVIECTQCFCSTRVFFGDKIGIEEWWNTRTGK
jgi:hypothetical protein